MKILLLGSGGREHALAWALSASSLCTHLYCAPGNSGIAQQATCVPLDIMDFAAVTAFAKEQDIDFVVVGPEAPAVAGIVDHLEAHGLRCFGARRDAARLEGSKAFTKALCQENAIPTAAYAQFEERQAALDYLDSADMPIVVKADGLAAGKGAIVCTDRQAAQKAVHDMFDGAFGAAGDIVVIEEFLRGEEASLFVLCDGRHILPLATAQDHKAVGEGDTGPNTGGMGAYSPAPVLSEALVQQSLEAIIRPTVAAMAARGTPFTGVLYAGLMITASGPKLIEYNVRFGDPECQVLMLRLKSDLLPALLACRDGVLNKVELRWYDEAAITVIMATEGYPGAYKKGSEIRGLAQLQEAKDLTVFHAATKAVDGRVYADGGRVLCVSALAPSLAQAQKRAYAGVDQIDWPQGFCRRDIGWRAID